MSLYLSPELRACRFPLWANQSFRSVVALTDGLGCGKCKRVHERVASILPFSVTEKIADKPLRIQGLAMTAGLSRNFNLYTPQELEAFSGKLTGAPVYLEHVSVNDAVGKVTKTDWDGQNLLYEAEIYDEETAQKIRKGLIRHVSVGADYETLDVTSDGKVPHGLHNAEMSLVAVPGIPETNIRVLEALAADKRLKLTPKMRELLEPLGSETLRCVFCGKPGEYLVSVCTGCGDNAQLMVTQSEEGEKMQEKDIDVLAEKVAAKLKTKEALLLKCPKCGQEFDAQEWEANGYKCPNAACGVEVAPPEAVVLRPKGEQSALEKIAAVEAELSEKQTKLAEAEGKVAQAEGKLVQANNTIEKLKALVPGVDLLAEPPKLMPVSEALERLARLELPKVQERLSLGNQLQAQKVRKEIFEVKQKYGVA